ncbi:MAG: emp24/gp25L/p24 family protein [Candidatus Bathyarchaeales archaeon]
MKTAIFFFVLFFTLVSSFVVGFLFAETATYDVLPQQQQIVTVNLNAGDKIAGTILVNGEGTIAFWISDPQNNNVTVSSSVGQKTFSLTAETSGTFSVHLYNEGVSVVSVTLNFNVAHQIFGVPHEIFLLMVIVGIVLLLIMFWAILAKA